MTKLKPEVRVNKLGVPVTKHVRIDASSSNLTTLPSPIVSASTMRALKDRLYAHLQKSQLEGRDGYASNRGSLNTMVSWLNELSETTLEEYASTIEARPTDGFADLLYGVLNYYVKDDSAGYFLEIAKTDPKQDFTRPDSDDRWDKGERAYKTSGAVYHGIRTYKNLQFEVLPSVWEYDADEMTSLRGLFRLTGRMLDHGTGYGIDGGYSEGVYLNLSSEPLARLALSRPHEADRIADIVCGRRTTDISLIEAILDAETPSISEGIL